MKVEVFKEAQEAYAKGDYKAALEGFIACTHDVAGLAPADLSKFYHLIGNCYVKSNDPRSAAEYYLKALTGSPEKRKPSLYVNLGTALLGTKDYENALEAFGRALDYPIYTTPYKAYAGIGAAQLKLGNMVEAGAAYREAALDPANPAPAKSLVNLGVCFMELGRPKMPFPCTRRPSISTSTIALVRRPTPTSARPTWHRAASRVRSTPSRRPRKPARKCPRSPCTITRSRARSRSVSTRARPASSTRATSCPSPLT